MTNDRPQLIGAPVVSFDVFDTLISRCVSSPEDIFKCAEKAAIQDGYSGALGFSEQRIEAQSIVERRVGPEYTTLDLIYEEIDVHRSDALASVLRVYEEQAELDMCVPIIAANDLMNRMKALGYPVVLISDMYLSSSFVKKMLKKCGIPMPEKLYVSCEWGATKQSGELFLRVLQDCKLEPDQLLHFGDNFVGDYFKPRKIGCRAYLMRNGEYINLLNLFGMKLKNRLGRKKDNYFEWGFKEHFEDSRDIGFSILGPLLLAFLRWVHDNTSDAGVSKILFLARDGYLMSKGYSILYPDDNSEYVYMSRRALSLPILDTCGTLSEVVRVLGLHKHASAAEFCERIGLSFPVFQSFFSNSAKISETTNVFDLPLEETSFVGMRELIRKNLLRERKAALKYIDQVVGAHSNIGIVDLGWAGTIQNSLQELLNKTSTEVSLYGLYMGVDLDSPWADLQRMKGFLFDPHEKQFSLRNEQKEKIYNALLELLFSAPHSSTRKYMIDDAGYSVPVFEDSIGERSDIGYDGTIKTIQEASLEFLKFVKDHNLMKYLEFKDENAIKGMERLGLSPLYSHANDLGNCNVDYLGEVKPLARPRKLSEYFFHPISLFDDVKHCYWKPGFFRRLLRLPFPYGRGILFVKNIIRI